MASLPAFAVLLPSAWAAFQALARAPAPAASAPPERVSLPLPATMTSLPAAASRPSRSATASFVTVALPPVGSLLAASGDQIADGVGVGIDDVVARVRDTAAADGGGVVVGDRPAAGTGRQRVESGREH